MREGADKYETSLLSWTLPDGFPAFQFYDNSSVKFSKGKCGNKYVRLIYYVLTDKADKKRHKNGIAPNWVHSYDSYLLRLMVNAMPYEAPISTVHDQFSTTSYYIEELQEAAKHAYKTIADHKTAEDICNKAFGYERELPKVGNWTIEEIDKAEFIIC